MHKILLTGSNGLLGQKLVHLLRGRADVELLASSSGENRISNKEGYRYRTLDISDREQVMECVKSFAPTAIINTAAMTLVDLCETEQERCQAVNVDGVRHLLDASKLIEAHLLQVSTDFVFNGEAGPYKETDRPDPLSVYSKSKHEAEQLLIQGDYENWSIARTIILYGVGENMSRSNIVLWARETLKKGGPMRIVNDQYRAPTLAEDLALGCWAIIERKEQGVFHLSGPETLSVIALVRRIADYYGFDHSHIEEIDTASLGQPAKRPPRTGFILSKARERLDYMPRNLEEGLSILDEQLPL